ncbi:MAG: asparaginase [Shewanella psychromarinicola]|jgi:L-asparaginase|uniref:L-asparaginase 1 n=1 Tax=Shewanella psychromarinicola TaxID=2487742 RepID=A0A3N4E4L6_9GAMM|nr:MULTISPECIES: asparaginase [Shewanella]AZG36098.1 L-asparaginase 1 [Shewanella psychromarinicola]MCL1080470.1 asparaginase [Shewanella psychromarinicola]PKG77400.1 L-asparaginase 1 [Shewanella sp. Actino-trap-3]RPA31788.1 L-asparaginase 1 [Shewanella psychromarinicola]|tara:strand:- start:167297 stop:168310 length:1014 start_codon:yes stop_codon:yes gene_type:complete
MTNRSIYVAYTGGTIGMQKTANGFAPVAGFLTDCVQSMPEFYHDEMPHFVIHEYSPLIDSSNMAPPDWQLIANDIQANYDKYDGFVILHGTDTMAYTASALSFMLQGLSKPVIVTGSQIPLAQLRSDGQTNLLNSLYIAANYPVAEVCLFFNNKLFRGNRSTKAHADGFDAFASPNFPMLLEAGIKINLKAGKITKPTGAPLEVVTISPQPVGVVTLYPGISTDIFNNILQQPVKALILLTFGVGNAPQDKKLLETLKQADERGIVLVNLTQCFQGKVNMAGYATGNALAQAGVIGGADMTVEAALAKLHYLLSIGLTSAQIKQRMQQNLIGELTID